MNNLECAKERLKVPCEAQNTSSTTYFFVSLIDISGSFILLLAAENER
jgi:hypothetical protein